MPMRTIITHTILVILSFIAVCPMSAQTATPLPFIDDFETPEGNAQWQKNTGGQIASRLTNRWVVSSAESFTGDSCLLISSDGGQSAVYSHTQNTAVAYRDFWLIPGTYDLSIAWQTMGDKDKDCLYVCWAPVSQYINISSSVGGKGKDVNTYARPLGKNGERYLSGSMQWTVSDTTIVVAGTGTAPVAYRLYLVWDNDGANGRNPSACVDYIQIASRACSRPDNIKCTYKNTELNINWTGAASGYEVSYRKYGDRSMTYCGKATSTGITVKNVPEGMYDVLVRSVCNPDTGIWVSCQDVFVYDPSLHCLDYLNLHAEGVECTYGNFKNPYMYDTIVDDGPVKSSMHTLYTVQGETDPRTGGLLKTIPDGAIASVRLSNWVEMEDSPSASISYTYEVKPDAQILLIRYAAVLQYESAHASDRQTRIVVEVFNEDGDLISNCTKADFNARDVAEGNTRGWNTYDPRTDGTEEEDGLIDRYSPIKWLDWATPLGVNLSSEIGKTVKIRITVFACESNFHFAYTYFTLDCEAGNLEGYTCGEFEEYSVKAPDGFDYEWYRHDDPQKVVIHRGQELSVPSAQADTFVCDVIYKENDGCRFPLTAYLVPRVPVPAFDAKHTPHNCENWLTLQNNSGVMIDGRLSATEKCDYTEWTIKDLSPGGKEIVFTDSISPELSFPDWGDTISVRLVSGISGGQCREIKEIDSLIIPPIREYDDTIVQNVCKFPYVFGGQPYDSPGVYTNRYDESRNKSYAGCDSILTLDLRYSEAVDTTLDATICEGDTFYLLPGLKYWVSSPPEGYTGTTKSVSGCDSVITLHLTVEPEVKVEFDSLPEICADDAGFDAPYTFLQGSSEAYSLRFGAKALATGFDDVDSTELADGYVRIPLPADTVVRPDHYTVDVLFHTEGCGVFAFPLSFTVNYPADSIMAQKWNDALALFNSSYGYGGYEYSRHQWYKNGAAIPGATGSYIYIGRDGGRFDSGDEYRVQLTRMGDTVSIMSCPFIPSEHTDKSEYITLRQPQGVRALYVEPVPDEAGVARWYSPAGQYLDECLVSDSDGSVVIPAAPGVYILRLVFPSETLTFKVVI